jgi:glucokinase-like ROK family protein
MSKITLGIDLGGTGIKFGLVDEHGRLLRNTKVSTPSKRDPLEVIQLMEAEAKTLLKSTRQKIHGIGIGTAGDVDPKTGTVRMSPNLHWTNVPLKVLIGRRLKYPITVENDANVAAWAAYVVEAKRRVPNLLCVTVGTGVGGGLIVNGQLYRGTTGSAGEIGHMTLYPEGVLCPCGNQGCLERYVGALAMAEEARHAIESGEKSIIPKLVQNNLSKITPLILAQAARKNDKLALHLWDQVGERLGIGLAGLINVFNPGWIVIAGGLSRSGSLLLDPVRRTILHRSFQTPARAAKLVISKLDQDLGVVGAGLIAH